MGEESTIKYSFAALALLKADLGFYCTEIPDGVEEYLVSLLIYAYDDFAEMGVHLTPGEIRSDTAQRIHAAWMYRNGPQGNGKTPMLKSIIRNWQVSAALADEEESV